MPSPSTPSSSASSPGPSKEPPKSLEESEPKDTVTPSSDENSEENVVATQGNSTQASSSSETTPPMATETTEATSVEGGSNTTTTTTATTNQNPWQAIYSPQYNAYYFFNTETEETTWQNPLQPEGTGTGTGMADASAAEAPTGSGEKSTAHSNPSSTLSSSSSSYNALQAAAIAQGIDPSLAYLDPSLAGPSASSSGLGGYGATAKFNARTGQFTRADARDPTHLSEYERAKRMSEFYFDVNAWEAQRATEQEVEAQQGGEKKRKRPSKKDLERFKEQKRQKKIAKTAWLRT